MKAKFYPWVLIVFFTVMGVTLSDAMASDKAIKWLSYDEGMALSKQEGKKIFLHFYSDRCGWCAKMKNSTFKDAKVIDYLNHNYIAIRVNSQTKPRLAYKYAVRAVPNNFFISEKGENITQLPGFLPAAQFLPIITFIQTESYKTMTYQEFRKKQQ